MCIRDSQKGGHHYSSPRHFNGNSFKKLLSENIEIGRPKFNIFSNHFFYKIQKLDELASNLFEKNLKYHLLNY